jgi:predicted enzyme related to lactoylglutathione lyase
MVKGVAKVVVPVADQERSKRFWTEQLGFSVLVDQAYGDQRWLELAPPNGSPVLVLTTRGAGELRTEPSPELPHSPVFFSCDDIERTHREMVDRGVRFAAPPKQMSFGWWSMFEDCEGTRYALGQW